VSPWVASLGVLASCLFGPAAHSPLRGYEVLIERRDVLSDDLAVALAARGFTVRRRVHGGSPRTVALVTVTLRDPGPPPTTWLSALLADTRSGAVIATVSAPLAALGPTPEQRAQSLADSFSARLAAPPPAPQRVAPPTPP